MTTMPAAVRVRRGRLAAAVTGVGVLVAFLAGAVAQAPAALAVPPFDVEAEITDPEGVLGGRAGDVQDALDRLADETDLQLFVVFVPDFDGQGGVDWANHTANASDLGRNDLLLAVATEARRYGLSYDNNVDLTDSDLDRIESAAEGYLRDEDWAGAAIAAADTTRAAAAPSTGAAAGEPRTGASPFVVLVVVGVLALLVWLVVRAVRRRGRDATAPGGTDAGALASLPTPELDRRASSALVAIDDAVKTSEQELGFAQAQFGIEETRRFQVVLEDAHAKVSEAFALRQRLDDDQPEDEPQAREMMVRIITLCTEVSEALDAESATFDELRDLQTRAPEALDDTGRRADEVTGRVASARAALATLATTYPPASLASVTQNPDQATALLEGARQAVAEGRAALDQGDRGEAVRLVRVAENAVGQAATLLDAVDRAGEDLAEAGPRLETALASITADLTDTARLAPGDAGLAPAVTEAQGAVAEGEAARSGGDPLAALRRLTEAEAALDAALAPWREQAERHARANALLRETLGRVQSQVRATNEYIETRRGAVGPEARTRLSEAIRLLTEAQSLQPTDPEAALARAQQADMLARDAARLAQQDEATWSQRSPQGGGSNVGGMVLGGILLDQVLRGGNRGYGGGYGGGFGGGGLGGRTSSSSRGRTSGGRSSGGRPSGGRSSGGRSSGGRSGRGGRF